MMILINAFKSITRSKGRNILIGIIVLTISISCSIALAIRSAADSAKETGTDSQSISGTISVDREKMMEEIQGGDGEGSQPDMDSMRDMMQDYSELSLDEMLKYADSDYVQNFTYTGSSSLNAAGELEAYSTESSSDSDDTETEGTEDGMPGGGMMMNSEGGMGGMGQMAAMGDFTITGYSSETAMTSFTSGESKISDGEMFDIESSDSNCLISNELAVFNGLSVGDTITLSNPNDEEESYTLTISGIYTTSSSTSDNQMVFGTAQDPANQIYISYSALEGIADKSEESEAVETSDDGMETTTALSLQTSGTYTFANTEDYESFEEEITDKGLSDYYTLSSTDISSYESSLIPLENLSSFATTLLWIILGVGSVILIVLNIFNIRERKYEVGVLTAIGIKKGKVAVQFVTELLAVTIVAVIIGTGIGAVVSVPISNNLLESQVSSQEESEAETEENFGRGGQMGGAGNAGSGGPSFTAGGGMFGDATSAVEYVDTINATISFDILGQLILIGLLLTIISSFAGVIFVLRYEPLQILSNRA